MCCNSASGNSSIAYWNRFAIRLIHVCFYCFLIPFTLCESGIQNGDCFSCDQDSYFPWVTVLHTQEKKTTRYFNKLPRKDRFHQFPVPHTTRVLIFLSIYKYMNSISKIYRISYCVCLQISPKCLFVYVCVVKCDYNYRAHWSVLRECVGFLHASC